MAHINFSGFKLVHRDEDKAILKKGAHEMHLSIKSLHPGNQKELNSLPLHKNHAKSSSKEPAQKFAEGTPDIEPTTISLDQPAQLPDFMVNPTPGSQSMAAPLGAQERIVDAAGSAPYGSADAAAQLAPPPAIAPEAPQAPIAQPAPQQQSNLPQPQNYAGQMQQATDQQIGGMNKEAQALGDLGKQQAQTYEAQAKAQQEIASHIQQATQTHQAEIQSVVDDIKAGHIDPHRYMSNMGTADKMASGIGLILGGIGAGIAHGPNMALDFLNKQIDRDIEGQKAEMSKKENLVNIYSKMLGNERDGAIMASNVLAQVTANKILEQGAKSQDPIVKARAQTAAAGLVASRIPEMQKLNMSQGMLSMLNSQASSGGSGPSGQWGPQDDQKQAHILKYMQMANPEMYKTMEAQYVPGVGVSSRPVDAPTRDLITAKQTLGQQAQRFYDWSKAHSGEMSLYAPKDVAQGATMAAELQSDYRNSINGGVFKKGEQEFIDNIVDSDPTKFFNSLRVLPKLKEVIDSNDQKLNIVKRNAGLPATAPKAETSDSRPQIIVNKATGERRQLINGQYQKI